MSSTCPSCGAKGRQTSTTRDGVARYSGGNLHGCRRCRLGWSGAVGPAPIVRAMMGIQDDEAMVRPPTPTHVTIPGPTTPPGDAHVTPGDWDELSVAGETAPHGSEHPSPPRHGTYYYIIDGRLYHMGVDGVPHPADAASHDDQERRRVGRDHAAERREAMGDTLREIGRAHV